MNVKRRRFWRSNGNIAIYIGSAVFVTITGHKPISKENALVVKGNRVFCIMVDDNLHVLETAKRVGMATIGVYDESSKAVAEEMRRVADKYVEDFAELLE